MRLTIDTDAKTLEFQAENGTEGVPLYSREGFEILSREWLKVGWAAKYPYTFSWFGRPIIQLPEDLLRVQEVIYRVRPDVVIETGVAHGGSLIFYATLCKGMEHGRVIGIDIEIRPHNRKAIEEHPLCSHIELVEGSSTNPSVVDKIHRMVKPRERALVLLDSDHSYRHVSAELEAYHDLVGPGSYIVACDGLMEILHDVPRGNPRWKEDNPAAAARDFAKLHNDFVLEQPPWTFNQSTLTENVTHWPGAWLRRKH